MARFGTGRVIPGLVVLLCLLATVPLVAIAQGGILSVNVSGDGAVAEDNGTLYVWSDEPYEVSVRFEAYSDQDDYIVCFDRNVDDSGCAPKRERSNLRAGEEATVRFEIEPGEAGSTQVRVRLHGDNFGPYNPRRDAVTFTVHAIRKDGDLDDDGLSNREEARTGLDVTDPDTDDDGLADGAEVDRHGTAPAEADTDGDGYSDGAEVDRYGTDPTAVDTDGDGLPDGDEIERHDTDPTLVDSDGDGLSDNEEANVYDTAPAEADTDGDGYSDGEEIKEHDTDPTDAESYPRDADDLTPTPGTESSPFGLDAVVVGVVGLLVGTLVAIGFMRSG